MKTINFKECIRVPVCLGALVLVLAGSVFADDNLRGPALPACSEIEVPQGHRLISQAYAVGVQIYRWSGTRWDFVAPAASLFADEDFENLIGTHFAGPTWMSDDGSNVVAARVEGCTPDASAIPWLLLRATANDGDGLFSTTTYIQRVNTSGGLAPSLPGISAGVIRRVPYTAEYYFYRAEN